jgi:hypothetical protein
MTRLAKVAIRTAGSIVILIVVAAVGAWWLWLRPRTGPAVNWGALWRWLRLRAGAAINLDTQSVVVMTLVSIAVMLWGVWWWRRRSREMNTRSTRLFQAALWVAVCLGGGSMGVELWLWLVGVGTPFWIRAMSLVVVLPIASVWSLCSSGGRATAWLIFCFLVVLVYSNGGWLFALWAIANPRIFIGEHYIILWVFVSYVVSSVCCFGALYRRFGIKETVTGTRSDSPLDNLYFSIITWTTVGYGDFVPSSKVSQALAAYEALLGYFTMAALFASLVAVASMLK